jgi:cytidyltransferase-like protein
MIKKYAQGSVHGRFQPLHNGHLKYILGAKQYCDFIWIGITQYNIHSMLESPQDPHRQEEKNNPLTYFERAEIIREALLDDGFRQGEFDIIPFPIETPEILPDFLPVTIPIFTTIYDEWNLHKVDVLRQIGYEVIVLWEETVKEIDGMEIRELLCGGDERWRQKVPWATIRAIEKYRVRERIIQSKGAGPRP